MKISLGIPMDIVDPVEFQNADAVREMARGLEAAGADACFITDHPAPTTKWRHAGGHDALDPFAALAFVAACTTRMALHTHIVVLPYRNPFVTAKAVATVDVLSGGRMILGVGVGYMRGEFAAVGADFEGRGAAMDDALVAMKAAWSGESVVHEGPGYQAVGNLPRPLPVQKPHPPIWVGGNSERAMRRAVEHCDGWSPIFATGALSKTTRTDEIGTVEDLGVKVEQVHEHLGRIGRTRPFDICAMPQTSFKSCDASEAQRYIDEAGKLAQVGATWLVGGVPHPSRAAFLDNVQWFGEEVLPHIHGLAKTA